MIDLEHLSSRRRRAVSISDGSQAYSTAAVALTSILAPHLLGGAFAWTTVCIAVLTSLSLAVAVWETRKRNADVFGADSFLGLFGVLLVFAFLHAVPVPAVLTSELAPGVVSNAVATAKALGLPPPNWVPISMDPGNTHERIVYHTAVLAAFCGARMIAVGSRSTPILVGLAISSLAVALSHLSHRALGATRVYGVYAPQLTAAYGPLVNPNNLAGFMAFGAPIFIGLAFSSNGSIRALWLLGALVVTASGLFAGSRGGTAAIIIGLAIYGALHWAQMRRRGARSAGPHGSHDWRSSALSATGFLALFIGLAYGLAELAGDDFLETHYGDLGKLKLFRDELKLLEDPKRLLLGVGRGGFSAAFTAGLSVPFRGLYSECLPLQYAIDLGLPVTALLAAGTLLRLRRGAWRWKSPAHLGGLAGVCAIFLQNLVDFSLELTGVAVPVAMCLAASLPRTTVTPSGGRLFGLKRASLVIVIASIGLLATVGASAWRADFSWNERQLQRALAAGRFSSFWARFAQVAPAHPSEPSFAMLAAMSSVTEGRTDAAFWLNRAMLLAPGWTTPHLWAAHWLVKQHRWDQAASELRLAAQTGAEEPVAMLCQWLSVRPLATVVFESTPLAGPGRRHMLDRGAGCLSHKPEQAAAVDERILQEEPNNLDARIRRLRRTLQTEDWASALAQARALRTAAPSSVAAYTLEAEALTGLGVPEEAVKTLAAAPEDVDDKHGLLKSLALAQTRAGDADGMRQTIERLRLESATSRPRLAETMVLLGRCEAMLGNLARALRAMQDASNAGAGESSMVEMAHLATTLGRVEFALSIWRRLCDASQSRIHCARRDELLKELALPPP